MGSGLEMLEEVGRGTDVLGDLRMTVISERGSAGAFSAYHARPDRAFGGTFCGEERTL